MTGVGVLKKGFVVHNHVYTIKIPKNTKVLFTNSKTPTIKVCDIPLTFTRVNGKWYAEFYGCLMLIQFPKGDLPYPMSYFK